MSVLDLPQVFAGFADPVVVLTAALFVVAESLGASGLTGWTRQQLVHRGGKNIVILIGPVSINGVDPSGDTGELHDLGAGRNAVRRILEIRTAASRPLPGRRVVPRASGLAVLESS